MLKFSDVGKNLIQRCKDANYFERMYIKLLLLFKYILYKKGGSIEIDFSNEKAKDIHRKYKLDFNKSKKKISLIDKKTGEPYERKSKK